MSKKNILLLSITILIVACGYKGALYLPKNAPAPSNPANNQYAPNSNQNESQPRRSLLPAMFESAPNESGIKTQSNESATVGKSTNN